MYVWVGVVIRITGCSSCQGYSYSFGRKRRTHDNDRNGHMGEEKDTRQRWKSPYGRREGHTTTIEIVIWEKRRTNDNDRNRHMGEEKGKNRPMLE